MSEVPSVEVIGVPKLALAKPTKPAATFELTLDDLVSGLESSSDITDPKEKVKN